MIRQLIIVVLLGITIFGQVNYNQRDDKYRLLGLKRAKELYEVAKKEYDRAQDLYKKKYLSEAEFDRIKGTYSDAEVNYQQSLLAVIFEQQFVSVQSAVKYQSKNGKKYVRLKIVNTSGGGEEYRKLLNIDDALFRSLQPDVITNVYLSLSNNDNSIVSQPYEAKIDELKFGKPEFVEFNLLQDLDAVNVNIIYGNGTTRTMKVFLQKDASQNLVVVQSQQFSQECELGSAANYDLTLELFSGVNNTFSLEVINLPEQINRFFKDPQSQARLSQFKFTENVNTRNALLEISLPDRPTDEIAMDKPFSFYVLVVPNDKYFQFSELKKKQITEQQIEQLKIGYVKLELVPRGNGKLLVKLPQLFFSINSGGIVKTYAELMNEGTRRLDNIELQLDLPFNWDKRVDPDYVKSLGVNKEKKTALEFIPPADIAPGRYEIRLKSSSFSDNQPVNGEDKIITVEIVSEANILGTAIVVLLILGVIGGIVYFGIKLSRK